LGPDTFTYEFNGTVPEFFDSEIVTVNINVVLLETYEDSLTACPYNGVATYDLTTVDVTAFATNPTFQFYPTLTDAENQTNEIVYPNAYVSASGSAFVRVTTPEGCFEFAKINLFRSEEHTSELQSRENLVCLLMLIPTPSSPIIPYTTLFRSLTTVDVTAFATNPTFQFYPTLTDAENQTNEIVYPNAYVSASGSAFVRVTTPEGCFEFAKINLF